MTYQIFIQHPSVKNKEINHKTLFSEMLAFAESLKIQYIKYVDQS